MAVRTGSLVADTVRIQDDTIPAAVAFATEIKGGIHSVTTLALRDAIPAYYRLFGMLCSVTNDPTPANNTIYKLWPTIDSVLTNNANWSPLSQISGNDLQTVTEGGAVTTVAVTLNGVTNGGSLVNTGASTFNAAVTINAKVSAQQLSIGYGNTNVKRGASVLGMDGLAEHPGETVFASGTDESNGDSQTSILPFRLSTFTNALSNFITGDSGNTVEEITIRDYTVTLLDVHYVVADSDGLYRTGYFKAVIKKSTGTPIVNVDAIGTVSPYDGTLTAPTLFADGGTGNVKLRGQGITARVLRWYCTVIKTTMDYQFAP
jgi:hypothetical protein